MPDQNRTEAERAADDFIGIVEEMQREVERADLRRPSTAVELAEHALASAKRWEAAPADPEPAPR